jgi:hypothetical protein
VEKRINIKHAWLHSLSNKDVLDPVDIKLLYLPFLAGEIRC